jgi:hypothetical protein
LEVDARFTVVLAPADVEAVGEGTTVVVESLGAPEDVDVDDGSVLVTVGEVVVLFPPPHAAITRPAAATATITRDLMTLPLSLHQNNGGAYRRV